MTTDRPAPRGVQAGFLSIVSGGRTCRTDELSEARRSRGDERRPRNRTWPLGVGRGAREPCCPHAPVAHIDRPSDGEVFARTEESQHWSAAGRDPRGPMMCLTVKNDRTARALNGTTENRGDRRFGRRRGDADIRTGGDRRATVQALVGQECGHERTLTGCGRLTAHNEGRAPATLTGFRCRRRRPAGHEAGSRRFGRNRGLHDMASLSRPIARAQNFGSRTRPRADRDLPASLRCLPE